MQTIGFVAISAQQLLNMVKAIMQIVDIPRFFVPLPPKK